MLSHGRCSPGMRQTPVILRKRSFEPNHRAKYLPRVPDYSVRNDPRLSGNGGVSHMDKRGYWDLITLREYLTTGTHHMYRAPQWIRRADAAHRWVPTLHLEIHRPVGFHSYHNKAHLIQQLELFLGPAGFQSNPNKAHLIQQLEQGWPTLFLEIYRPVGFHSNPNKATPHSTARAGLANPAPGDLPSCRFSHQP